MMNHGRLSSLLLFVALIVCASCALADQTVVNPSFEVGVAGWTTYGYSVPPVGDPGHPTAGGVGPGQMFDAVPPTTVPDGVSVCGTQCDEGIAANGGVYQRVVWTGGPTTIYVTGRAYSEWPPDMGGGPYPDGCKVRMGLVAGESGSRSDVTSWVDFPWGTGWSTRSLNVSGPGTYTLFIESYQPYPALICSTLWDNVVWTAVPPIECTDGGPHVQVPGDEDYPDSTALVTWTTSVAATSKVEYGLTSGYGQSTENTTPTTDHSVLLTGLTNSSTYHFRVSSSAAGYSTWTSDDFVFQTPIQFSDVTTSVSSDGLSTIVMWRTDVPTTSQVEYGETTSYGSLTTEDTELVDEHSVSISGLLADHTYHFRVRGRNQPKYTDAFSKDYAFTTLPTPSTSLQNGSFELGHSGQTPSFYPWVQYTTFSEGYHPIDGLVGPYPAGGSLSWYQGIKAESGSYFMGAGGQRVTKNGGALQRVFVTPGDIYTFGTHFATYRQGGTDKDLRVRLGIDPDGGVDPLSENVVWWSTFSPTNNSQWHWATLSAQAGAGGVMTLFLDIEQQYANNWMVAAIDNAQFGKPSAMSIGQLKQATDPLGAVLEDKIVTRVEGEAVVYNGVPYTKAYIQETNRSSGIAVLFDLFADEQPEVTNLVSLTGSLVLDGMEAAVVAFDWDFDRTPRDLPKPVGIPQRYLGGSARNQPSLNSVGGPSNVGLRVRIFGRVTYIDFEDMSFGEATAYIDDGSRLLDHQPEPGQNPVYGVRVRLVDNYTRRVRTGDYISVAGTLMLPLIDPDGWPNTDDEFYAYSVITQDLADWNVLHAP